MANSNDVTVRFRLDIAPEFSLGIGKIELLEAIDRVGSLSQAAQEIGMSYRRAWLLIEDMKLSLDELVVQSTVGGAHGGGARVTDFGRDLIARFRALESRFHALAREEFADLSVRVHPKAAATATINSVSIKRKLARGAP